MIIAAEKIQSGHRTFLYNLSEGATYRIAGNIGGELNLAVWGHTASFKLAIIYVVWLLTTSKEKLKCGKLNRCGV